MQATTIYVAAIRKLIANDNLPEAIRQLNALFKNSAKLNEAILQSARFEDISRQIRIGVVTAEEANLEKNKIRMGILDLLNTLEVSDDPGLAQEIENKAITVIQNAEKIYNIDRIDNANFY